MQYYTTCHVFFAPPIPTISPTASGSTGFFRPNLVTTAAVLYFLRPFVCRVFFLCDKLMRYWCGVLNFAKKNQVLFLLELNVLNFTFDCYRLLVLLSMLPACHALY